MVHLLEEGMGTCREKNTFVLQPVDDDDQPHHHRCAEATPGADAVDAFEATSTARRHALAAVTASAMSFTV